MISKILLVGFCFSLVFGYYVKADLNDGLISAWTFDDGSAKDSVSKNLGEITNAQQVNGKFAKALDFSKDTFVRIPHDKSMEVIVDGFSVSAWVFIRSFPQPNHAAIVFKGSKIGWSQDYAFRIATREQNQLTWAIPKPGSEGNFNTDNVAKTDEWTFVCLTADGTMGKAYVAAGGGEAIQVGSNNQAKPYQARVDEPIEIGVGRARGGTIGNDIFFDGIIDEVYLWDRALSVNEVNELAKGNRPTKVIAAVEPNSKLTTVWGRVKN